MNLKTLQEAISKNITLESARDNLNLLQEQQQKEKEYRNALNKIGVVLL